MRKIIHIDMDTFYASVEQHDHPELRGIPIAVGVGRSPSDECCGALVMDRDSVCLPVGGLRMTNDS